MGVGAGEDHPSLAPRATCTMTELTIFLDALELATPAERSTFLDQACGGDAALRARVEALLLSHEQGGSFLAEPTPRTIAEDLAKTRPGPATQPGPPRHE